jgi:hypothetical protein
MRKLRIMAEPSGPSISGEPALQPPPPAPTVKSKRKLYAVLGLVCIVVVVSTAVLIFLIPPGLGETVPYGFNYAVGEKMTYSMSLSASSGGQNTSETGTLGMDILSFDGANYTINETTSFVVLGSTKQLMFTLKMDKSGRIVEFSNLPTEMQQAYTASGMMPGFGFSSDKTEARVGETWQFPLNSSYSGFSMSGTINYKFGDIQNTTVLAGTYKVFKIDISSDNVQASGTGVSINMNIGGQMHMEYGTCRLIDMTMQVTETMTQGTQTTTASMNMQMQLTQHIKP